MKLAMDKSMRSYDQNNHLIVERTVITKACVNAYLGKEIVGWQEMGLEPEKIYNLLRDPEELKKALSSFKGVQLLIKHIQVDAKEPHKDLTVGSVGTEIEMEGDNVYASLRVFDKEAIGLIEDEKLNELSAGYMYRADMTAGEHKGEPYDGVMRDIHANHVALVERGRIGRDAVITDGLPTELMEVSMRLKKGSLSVIAEFIRQCAMDEEMKSEKVEEVVKAVQDSLIEDEDEDDEKAAKDSEKEAEDEEGEKSDDENKKTEKPKANDQDLKDDDKKESAKDSKGAMDAASIELAAVSRVTRLFEAKSAVEPVVGVVNGLGMDSAEKVYEYALKTKGIEISGVHPSAYEAMFKMIPKEQKTIATDSAYTGKRDPLTERFKR